MALTRPAETWERGNELPSGASKPDHVGNRTISNALALTARSVRGAVL
jgi:hypothetical protein